jgi:hypothetical protein
MAKETIPPPQVLGDEAVLPTPTQPLPLRKRPAILGVHVKTASTGHSKRWQEPAVKIYHAKELLVGCEVS